MPTISLNPLDLYPTYFDCNQVHDGDVSQSKVEKIEFLVHDIFNLQSLTGEE